jgi:hypothetical protein
MSICGDLRASGFRRLLSLDAETVSFRGSTLSAIVNRPTPTGPDMQEAATSLLGGSVIEFNRADLPNSGTPLGIGEIFTDENSATHRIVRIEATPDTWKLHCEPHDA